MKHLTNFTRLWSPEITTSLSLKAANAKVTRVECAATAHTEALGCYAIIALQLMVGITETPEQAAYGWTGMSDNEQAFTMDFFARYFCTQPNYPLHLLEATHDV
jgi:hypothetical protein